MFQKELMLIKRVHQKNVKFVTIGILKILVLSANHIFAMTHDLAQKAMSFKDVAIIYVKKGKCLQNPLLVYEQR